MRRRGASNDLRLRGDEWPLLPVVSGLSVVVATVVDAVSMMRALHRCVWPILACVAAASSLQLHSRRLTALRKSQNVPRSHACEVCGFPVFGQG